MNQFGMCIQPLLLPLFIVLSGNSDVVMMVVTRNWSIHTTPSLDIARGRREKLLFSTVRPGNRQCQRKSCSFGRVLGDFDAPLVSFHDAIADRKAQTRAFNGRFG